MTDPTTIALAREALSEHAGAVHAYEKGFNPLRPRTREAALARALLEAQEENERLRVLLIESRSTLREFAPTIGGVASESLRDFLCRIERALRPVAPSEKDGR